VEDFIRHFVAEALVVGVEVFALVAFDTRLAGQETKEGADQSHGDSIYFLSFHAALKG
jgi:hypothetical protein